MPTTQEYGMVELDPPLLDIPCTPFGNLSPRDNLSACQIAPSIASSQRPCPVHTAVEFYLRDNDRNVAGFSTALRIRLRGMLE